MQRLLPIGLLIVAAGTGMAAAGLSDPDPRLAGVRNAFVVAEDDLAFDRPVARCLAERLSTETPIATVSNRETADVILRVRAKTISDEDRMDEQLRAAEDRLARITRTAPKGRKPLTNEQIMARKPQATIVAELPDGTKLWEETYFQALKEPQDPNLACLLAGDLLGELRDAMREARDAGRQ